MSAVRYDWTYEQIEAIYDKPLLELIFEAASVHRQYFDPQKIQVSSLISIKTGGCPEDCHYCPQAARYNTGLKRQGLLEVEDVLDRAKQARAQGASRMCLGAAWREVKDNAQFERVLSMVREVNALGMEVCCTLGMLNAEQASRLKEAGLFAYNHNVDTSREHYENIISTRGYDDRLRTLGNVRAARLSVCSGGIIGLGESKKDRVGMLLTLSHLQPHPDSVPINTLVAVEGTPLEEQPEVEIWELVRMVATTRLVLPRSYVRLSAGRRGRSMQDQALCFMAGANSIFAGDKLLTTANPEFTDDQRMFEVLGLQMSQPFAQQRAEELPLPSQACDGAHQQGIH